MCTAMIIMKTIMNNHYFCGSTCTEAKQTANDTTKLLVVLILFSYGNIVNELEEVDDCISHE